MVEGLQNGEEQCITMTTVYIQGESPHTNAVCTIPFAVRRDHNTDILQITITNEGNIGYLNSRSAPDSLGIDSVGLGFVYTNNNYLYEGGLMVGALAGLACAVVVGVEWNMFLSMILTMLLLEF